MANTPPSINGSDPSIQRQIDRQTANITGKARTAAPIISGNEVVYPRSTTSTSNDAVTITTSVNNDSGDITTVYSTKGQITVNPVNQTINQYTSVDSGVTQIIAGEGVTIDSTTGNGTGVVTINAIGGGGGNGDYGNSNVANYLPTYTGNIGANWIIAEYVSGNANPLFNIPGPNVVGTVPSAATAATVTTAAQPNITSVGTLTSLSVSGTATAGNLSTGGNLSASGNAVIGGNLTVNGNLVYVNVDTLAVEDPIIQLQTGPNGAAPVSNSGKDVGTALNYYDSAARVAFMGWDTSNAEFGLASQASITNEVVTFDTYGNLRVGNINAVGNVNANYFVGIATNVSVEAVNNNYSYHMVFVTGSGDTSLHMDNDDNLQYDPAEGVMTVSRVDMDYLAVGEAVISSLVPFDSLPLDLGSNTNRWRDIYLSNSTIYLGNATITSNGNSIVVDSITINDGNIGTIGNIASINLDGSNSNVLYGNGVFAPAGGGSGSELVNGLNSFVLDTDGNVVFEGNGAGQGIDRGVVWDYGANANGVNSELRQDLFGITVRAYTENGGGANGYSAPVNIVTNQGPATNTWTFDGQGNLSLPGNIVAINDGGQIGAQVLFQPDLGKARLAARTLEYTENFNSGGWTSASYTGTQVNIIDAPNLLGFVSNNTIFTSAVDRTFSINGGDPVPYTGYGASGNNVTLFTDITADPDPTVVTSIDFYYQSESYFGIDYDDGGLDMIAAGLTINIDNDQTQGPDINLRSGDDITLQAKNKSLGSESEGGDINIYAGDGASDDGQGNTASTGGDIQIEAGQGGDGNSSSGSSGGFTTLRAGSGGQAGATNTAGSGGYVEIRGGNGGNDGGNTALGAGGGYVSITAGGSTQEGVNGAAVTINSGQAGPNALAGNVEISTPASANGPGGTWRFDGNGNLTLPSNTFAVNYANGTQVSLGGGGLAEASFSIQSTNFAATAGSRYGVNTSSSAVTATLPVSPETGAAVFFADAGGTYSTNNLTIDAGAGTIMGGGNTLTVSTNNQSVGLFYNGSTWRIYNAG